QLWCLYKEVQDYYNAGMRVPDDVTLLWAEDNWGNVRRLPTAEERKRNGGAGIYYHFDYHGGPRSYQWLNTNPVPKIWDQMSLAKQYGADRIWIVNVGHFKGYEFPIEYFLDLAWNTEKLKNENINEYTKYWVEREFGPDFASEISDLMSLYTKYNGRRKPELLSPSTYSLINYKEADKIVSDYFTIWSKAENVFAKLPSEKKDAFYQLVLFPVKASAMVNALYLFASKNSLYARQGRAATNDMADRVQSIFREDTALMGYYNRDFAKGKWNHFMDQSHLGYTSWADPPVNSLRAIQLKNIEIPEGSIMAVAVEGSEDSWPGAENIPSLPQFDCFNRQSHYIDVFNKGKKPFEYATSTENQWIKIGKSTGTVEKETRVGVTIDWSRVSPGKNEGMISISGTGEIINVKVSAFKPEDVTPETLDGFVEGEGYVSIEAEHFINNNPEGERKWIKIEDYGHTLSAMRANAPVDSPPATPGKDSPCLEYKMYLFTSGNIEVNSIFSPTLNFMPGRDLQYAISFDGQPAQIITLVPGNYNAQNRNADWEKSVSDNARFSVTKHFIPSPGYHTLKIWMVDPGVV
ncbi:MAG: glycosyl hydrolase 115 family protein, partial [Bacteroidia bacterium]|nr:glycosyl hydrolase 115 family protein [Bacteroidia bacterium]